MNRRIDSLLCSTFALSLVTTIACKDNPDSDAGDDAGDDASETSDNPTESDSDSDTSGGFEEPAPEVAWPNLECDSLVPEYCLFPYPNNVFTVDDPDSATGRRLALTSERLPTKSDAPVLADPFNQADGFSPALAPMTYFPGATAVGLPTWKDIPASLAADSATVLINAETGERVPHFAEIDLSYFKKTENALMIRPVVRLEDSTRYIVAIRKVVDGSGTTIAARPDFAALRDLTPTDNPELEARRPLYADIFMRLAQAGVERESLQIAWDFTTASEDNNTADLLHMRDDALAMYPPGQGPSYEIDVIETDFDPDNIAYRIAGRIMVPLYLSSPDPGGLLVYGDDGLPEMQAMAEYPFYVMIPHSAADTPAPLLQYGHGLLGGATELQSGHLRSFINEHNYVIFGVDWIGMADEDAINIATMLVDGDMHRFPEVSERLQQGMLNFMLATRMMKTSFADDPMFGSYIDPSNAYYLGISQGGIFGGTFMALTQDIERGCVGVPGQPYNLLLNRSVDFDTYFTLLKAGFDDSRDIQMLLALIQGLWDGAEPTGYSHRISNDPFPNTPAHELLIRAAVGDHQVTNLGAHVMARAVGAPHLDTGIREVWGLDGVSGSNAGSTYVEYDFGLPEDPLENVPHDNCDDPHGKLRQLPEAREQLHTFFQTGVVENVCTDGICSFPELSGC
ncbi:MAG: hypothetical protein KC457_02135 [Myxococcales bacterium]|nr:hypothetical protein [Myxococcales bacterium]